MNNLLTVVRMNTRMRLFDKFAVTDLLNRIARTLFVIALAVGAGVSTRAQQRPLITEDVDIIPPGSMRFEAGVDFFQIHLDGGVGDLGVHGVLPS